MQKALASGRIKKKRNGKIDPAVADLAWAANTDEGARSTPADAGEVTTAQTPADNQADDDDEDEAPAAPRATPLTKARTAKTVFDAKRSQLEYELAAGLLVRAADVEAEWSSMVSLVRTAVLGIAPKCKARLPHLKKTDVLVMQEIVEDTLRSLANGGN